MDLSAVDIRPFARCPHGTSETDFDFQCDRCFQARSESSTHQLEPAPFFHPSSRTRGEFEFHGLARSYAWLNPESQVLELHTSGAANVEELEAFVRHVDQILLAMIKRNHLRAEAAKSDDLLGYINGERLPTIEFRPETHPACIVAIVRAFMFSDSVGGRERFGQIICRTITQAAAATFATQIDSRRVCKQYRELLPTINDARTPIVTYVSQTSSATTPSNTSWRGENYLDNLSTLLVLAKTTGLYEHIGKAIVTTRSASTSTDQTCYTDRRLFRLKFPSMAHLKAAAAELNIESMSLERRLDLLLGAFSCSLGSLATLATGIHVPSPATVPQKPAPPTIVPAYVLSGHHMPDNYGDDDDDNTTHEPPPMPSDNKYFKF